MPDQFQSLVDQLTTQVSQIERDIQGIQNTVNTLDKNVADVKGKQQNIALQIGDVQSQISHIRDDQAQLRASLEETKMRLESELREVNASVVNLQNQIAQIAFTQQKEIARRRLEELRAKFVIDAKRLFNSISDGAVRYLFAVYALKIMPINGVGVDAFSGLSDKDVVSQFLILLELTVKNVPDDDKREATNFVKLVDLKNDLALRQRKFQDSNAQIIEQRRRFQRSQTALIEKISKLEQPETQEEAARRRTVFCLLLVSGITAVQEGF